MKVQSRNGSIKPTTKTEIPKIDMSKMYEDMTIKSVSPHERITLLKLLLAMRKNRGAHFVSIPLEKTEFYMVTIAAGIHNKGNVVEFVKAATMFSADSDCDVLSHDIWHGRTKLLATALEQEGGAQ